MESGGSSSLRLTTEPNTSIPIAATCLGKDCPGTNTISYANLAQGSNAPNLWLPGRGAMFPAPANFQTDPRERDPRFIRTCKELNDTIAGLTRSSVNTKLP